MLIALGIAVALSGCANVDWDSDQAWFAKPMDMFGRKGGYTFSELQETKQRQHPITAQDLVSSNGACPARPVAQPAPAASAAPGSQAAAQPAAGAPSQLGGGVALGMTECDVVSRAGTPTTVQIGKNPNGDRTAVLTFNGGPRPGVYHFEHGTLVAMDRVATPEPAPVPQVAKKKSTTAKSSKPPRKNET